MNHFDYTAGYNAGRDAMRAEMEKVEAEGYTQKSLSALMRSGMRMSKTPRTDEHCRKISDDALGLEYVANELQYWAEKLEEELAFEVSERIKLFELLAIANAEIAALRVNAEKWRSYEMSKNRANKECGK